MLFVEVSEEVDEAHLVGELVEVAFKQCSFSYDDNDSAQQISAPRSRLFFNVHRLPLFFLISIGCSLRGEKAESEKEGGLLSLYEGINIFLRGLGVGQMRR